MNSGESQVEARKVAETIARRSYGKLVAFLAARNGDVAGAEDALSEAFASALVEWPVKGCPLNPEAWLLTVARRKTIDVFRRQNTADASILELQLQTDGKADTTHAGSIPDRRLALMFACAHPAIDVTIRAPLILQVVLGLDAKKIASAFLVSPSAMGKRLVRAKEKIHQAGIPFKIPEPDEIADRLGAVLDAIYTAFSEGWTDPSGADPIRRDLTEEALFLAKLVTELLPDEPEALGLLALMLHAEARRRARRSPEGEYVPLAQQDQSLWDSAMIAEAEKLITSAGKVGRIGRFQLESALQSAHVHRCRTGHANWDDVLQLYDALLALAPSPVVTINRALAVAELQGAKEGLQALQAVASDAKSSRVPALLGGPC